MYHIVYLTENTITGMIYVGVHSTYNLEDGYIGSGHRLIRAIKKYGKSAFKRTILHFCLSSEDAYKFEEVIVDRAFVTNPKTYNVKTGGQGGYLGMTKSEDTKIRASERTRCWFSNNDNREKHRTATKEGISKIDPNKRQASQEKRTSSIQSSEIRNKISQRTREGMANMTEEQKKMMREKMSKSNCKHFAKQWVITNSIGQSIQVISLRKFCLENNLNYTKVYYKIYKKQLPCSFWQISML